MKKSFLLLFCILLFTRCNNQDKSEEKFRTRVLSVVEDYVLGHLKTVEREVSEDGIISIGDDQKKYFIDPAKILIGLIDDDQKEDAIATIVSYGGQYPVTEHLLIINTNGKLTMLRSVESDMRILGLNERTITADVPTHPRSSPLYYCPECREIVRFRFNKGDLEKIQQVNP
jgi:hypothetical protein